MAIKQSGYYCSVKKKGLMILPLRSAQNLNSAKAIFRKTTRAKFYYGLYNEGFVSICNVYYMVIV